MEWDHRKWERHWHGPHHRHRHHSPVANYHWDPPDIDVAEPVTFQHFGVIFNFV